MSGHILKSGSTYRSGSLTSLEEWSMPPAPRPQTCSTWQQAPRAEMGPFDQTPALGFTAALPLAVASFLRLRVRCPLYWVCTDIFLAVISLSTKRENKAKASFKNSGRELIHFLEMKSCLLVYKAHKMCLYQFFSNLPALFIYITFLVPVDIWVFDPRE